VLQQYYEWMGARRLPRFNSYRRGRQLLEAFLQRDGTPWHAVDEKGFERARRAPELREAEALLRQALELTKPAAAPWDSATAFYEIGLVCHRLGRIEEAAECFRQCLALSNRALALHSTQATAISDSHYQLGILSWRRGDYSGARAHLDRSIAIDRPRGKQRDVVISEEAIRHLGLADVYPAVLDDQVAQTPEQDAAGPLHVLTPGDPPSSESALSEPSDASLTSSQVSVKPVRLGPTAVLVIALPTEEALPFQQAIEERLPTELDNVAVLTCDRSGDFVTPAEIEANARIPIGVVVLVMEGGDIDDQRYLDSVEWAIQRVAQDATFRLFVGSSSNTLGRHLGTENSGSPRAKRVLQGLADTVQLGSDGTPAAVADGVLRFLTEAPYLQAREAWRSLVTTSAWIALALSIGFELSAFAIFGAWAASEIAGWSVSWGLPPERLEEVAMLAYGMTVAPIGLTLAYFALRGSSAWAHPAAVMTLLGAFGYVTLADSLRQAAGLPFAAVLFGACVGLTLEYIRRECPALLRRSIRLGEVKARVSVTPLPPLAKTNSRGLIDILRMPLVSSLAPRVFLSYARRTAWSEPLARAVHVALAKIRAISYLDRESIPNGSNWRSALNEHLADCDVFVSLLEEESYEREWVAAEILTAIEMANRFGPPDIIVVRNQSEPGSGRETGIPLMTTLAGLGDTGGREERFRVVTVSNPSSQEIAAYLDPYHYVRETIVPAEWSRAVPWQVPVAALGATGGVVGAAAVVLWWMETEGAAAVGPMLARLGWLNATVVLLAYFLGFTIRTGLYSLFEYRSDKYRHLTIAQGIACSGFVGLLCAWGPSVPQFALAWAAVVLFWGWVAGDNFLHVTRVQVTALR
jgi:tetratricopeptide (TPR) repeat protein